MKKIICLCLCMIIFIGLLSGCFNNSENLTYDKEKIDNSVVKRKGEFAFDIFKELNSADTNKNIFISPISISTALSMTYQGAKKTTKEAMAEGLRYEGIDKNTLNETYKNLLIYLKQADSKVKIDINNSIWINKGEKIKEDFINANKDVFDAYIKSLDFSKKNSADKINGWISDSTNKKIEKMINPPIDPSVVMYLINAIYFNGDWAEGFDKDKTFETEFKLENKGIKKVSMMKRKGEVEYLEKDNYKAVRLPYGDGKLSMYCILPKEGKKLKELISKMNTNMLENINKDIVKTDDVIIQIPRFKIEYGVKKLNDSLTKLGMGEAFEMDANFNGIREGIFINKVLHKAVIEVNEKGSKAAGATVVEMKEAASLNPKRFIANRPFMFIIRDDEYGTILFMGKYIK
ncbi:MAG: serpin family protein [Firmicutes bacterium]|nr:serpin family protein [Bacillota bacterium]